MPLTILADEDVRGLLHSLTREDILVLQQSLADSLHYYSSGDADPDNNNCSASHQPARIQMSRKDGSTTLFMPGSSNTGMGFKVVTVGESNKKAQSDSSSFLSSAPSTEETTRSSLSSFSLNQPSTNTSRSSTSGDDIPSYPVQEVDSDLSSAIPAQSTSPTGSLTLLDKRGAPRAFINASEITAFRTALASTMLFNKRHNVHDVVIFGAGKQAYWHARLALILRGKDVHHLNVINRSFDRAVELMQSLFKTEWPVAIPHPKTEIITPSHSEYERHLKNLIRGSSAIFFTTPSASPLFPAEILTHTEGRKKGRYLAAIGSYKPHMIEIHPDIIRQAVAPQHKHHHHRHARQGGAIIVDTVDGCLKEAGELIQAGVSGQEVVEIGELVMLKRDAERRKLERQGSASSESSSLSDGVPLGRKNKKGSSNEDDGGLHDWLARGNVIYKSVGMALMDCVIGNELVNIADQRNIGIRLDNF